MVRQPVRHALHLLKASVETVDEVAARAGMGTSASLASTCARALGCSPAAYRHTFRGAPGSA